MGKDPAHIVGDRPHHKAVEERDRTAAAGAGDDAPRWQKLEIGHRLVKPLGPQRGIALGGRKRARHAAPGILYRLVERLARHVAVGGRPQTIFHVPDLLRDRADESHGRGFLLSLTREILHQLRTERLYNSPRWR